MILMDLRECWFTRQCGERCPAQQIVMAGGSFNRSLPKTSCFNATLGARHSLDAGDEPFFHLRSGDGSCGNGATAVFGTI